MTLCPHCADRGVSSGADDLGGPGSMSPCDCDAGLAWVAWGGDIRLRSKIGAVEVVPMSAYRAQRDSLTALLRQANDRADRAEMERDTAHCAGYEFARADAAKIGWHLVRYDFAMKRRT